MRLPRNMGPEESSLERFPLLEMVTVTKQVLM